MVEHTFVFALAIVPGMAICWYIYRMDKYEKELIQELQPSLNTQLK